MGVGFGDCTSDDLIRQMAGQATNLRIEAGCYSGAASATQPIPTQLTHVVGGFLVGCDTDTLVGRPLIGSVCEGAVVDFTCSVAPDDVYSYMVAGW